jgi:2-polyprenyl-3-methyl-5-hydroxy-6-metoxy-1,4-benzoquinol methylase
VSCPVCKEINTKFFEQINGKDYFRCQICHAIFIGDKHRLAPADEEERYAQHNNDIYDKNYRKFLSRLYDPLVKKLTKGSTGLDYGCGPGPALAEMFKEAGFNIDIYDPYFYPDDSFLNKKYQFITCTEAAEHFYNPYEEFNTIDDLLEIGGWLGVMTNFLDESIKFKDWYYRKDPTHVVFYTEKTFKIIASSRSWKYEIPSKDIVLFKK